MTETIFASIGLTILIASASYIYYNIGKRKGIEEVMGVVLHFEPKAFNRLHVKLKKELDAKQRTT